MSEVKDEYKALYELALVQVRNFCPVDGDCPHGAAEVRIEACTKHWDEHFRKRLAQEQDQ